MSFSSLGLDESLLRTVAAEGYESPTPVQSRAIPAILAGRDVQAAAQTGTGKTAAFTLPLLQRLMQETRAPDARRHPRALVLVPTRELAAQVSESIRTYGRHGNLRTVNLIGGVGMQPQIEALRRGVDIVVATPGRLIAASSPCYRRHARICSSRLPFPSRSAHSRRPCCMTRRSSTSRPAMRPPKACASASTTWTRVPSVPCWRI